MTILCPVDFSAATPALVALAAALAVGAQAELLLLHVLEGLPLAGRADAHTNRRLAECQEAAHRAGARTSIVIRCGTPAPTILAEADAAPAGLLVLGTHGHSQLHRFLMGSTAEEVLRKATCPTLVVKDLPPDQPPRLAAH